MYIPRKRLTRTAGVALAVFSAGAGIGWTLADLWFVTSDPLPTVAAIRFDDAYVEAIPAPPLYDSFIAVAPQFPSSPQSAGSQDTAGPVSEERRLAQALEWAERYRQRQQSSVRTADTTQRRDEKVRVATIEANRWSEVADHANRIRQPQVDVRKLVTAPGEHHQGKNAPAESKVASAASAVVAVPAPPRTATPEQVRHVQAVRCEDCGRRPAGQQARRRTAKARTAGRHSRRATAVRAGSGFMCPLRWLEAAVMGDRRKSRRYTG